MASRGLLDDVLVAVARSVRRWADQVLTERAHETSALSEPPAPRDEGALDEDGPPAHWVEMLRERAPHLLPPHSRRRSSAGQRHDTPAETPDGAADLAEPAATVSDESAEPAHSDVPARQPGDVAPDDETSWSRDPELRTDRPAMAPRTRSTPSVQAVAEANREDVTRSRPFAPAKPGATTGAPALEPAGAGRSADHEAGGAGPAQRRNLRRAARADGTGSDAAELVPRDDGQTLPETADRRPRDDREDRHRARDVSPRIDQRNRAAGDPDRGPDAAKSEMIERLSRHVRATTSEPARRSLRWYRVPEPEQPRPIEDRSDASGHDAMGHDAIGYDAVGHGAVRRNTVTGVTGGGPTGHSDSARTSSDAVGLPARRLRDPATGRHEPTRSRITEQASRETAAFDMQAREAAPARRETARPPRAVADAPAATRTLRRRAAAESSALSPVDLPRTPLPIPLPLGAHGASTAYESSWDLGAAPAASPWQLAERGGHVRTFSLSSEMCAALWPRLPDEGDEVSDDRPGSARGWPAEGLWPQLMVDDLVPVEEPTHFDADRDERLRREQRGLRWSERRS